jgi:predicted transcriptional regulator
MPLWYQIDTIIFMAMTLRLNEKTEARLDDLASATGRSKQNIIAEAVEKYLETQNEDAIVQAAFAEVLKRDAKLLERLADA